MKNKERIFLLIITGLSIIFVLLLLNRISVFNDRTNLVDNISDNKLSEIFLQGVDIDNINFVKYLLSVDSNIQENDVFERIKDGDEEFEIEKDFLHAEIKALNEDNTRHSLSEFIQLSKNMPYWVAVSLLGKPNYIEAIDTNELKKEIYLLKENDAKIELNYKFVDEINCTVLDNVVYIEGNKKYNLL